MLLLSRTWRPPCSLSGTLSPRLQKDHRIALEGGGRLQFVDFALLIARCFCSWGDIQRPFSIRASAFYARPEIMIAMPENLLRETWANLDSHELRLLLAERIG